jgi:hypothetical protein
MTGMGDLQSTTFAAIAYCKSGQSDVITSQTFVPETAVIAYF